MEQRPLGATGMAIAPLVLGSNVFGWTIDEPTSFAVLDAFIDHGFDAIDTADVYSNWAPGNQGGEAETIIGRWLSAQPGVRDRITLFTKVGWDLERPGEKGLSRRWIVQAVERSLRRLQTDVVDVYFAHTPDAETPYEETLAAFDELLKAGKVRAIGASNHDAAQLSEALRVAETHDLPRYQVLQPQYNLYDRQSFDGPLRDLSISRGLGVVTYFSLASGFLTGKYRAERDIANSARAGLVAPYLDDRGALILQALAEVAQAQEAELSEIALAWLMMRRGVTAPIASATSTRQVASFAKATAVRLSTEQFALLDEAGRADPGGG